MFTGYYRRRHRHLKLSLISIFISIALILLFFYRQNGSLINQDTNQLPLDHFSILKKGSHRIRTKENRIGILKTSLSSSALSQKTLKSAVSSIEFLNSPFLDLEFNSSNITPILVLSKASNIEIRDAIRRTWGFVQSYRNDTVKVKLFFLVGIDDYMIKRVRAEQCLFADVIQVSIPEAYSFTVYKELAAMIWVRSYLPNAPFYIKTEDDVIINMKAIINLILPAVEVSINQNVVIGWFDSKPIIERGIYQKFVNAIMPPSEFMLYYALGLLYVVTSKASDSMLNALSHIDNVEYPGDPFVTGILRDVAHVGMKDLATFNETYMYELSNGGCRTSFEKNPNLLFCTVLLPPDTVRSVFEYFNTWDIISNK